MERIKDINFQRIAWCCAQAGIGPSELAAKLHINAESWRKLQSGESGLTFAQLKRVAEFFGRTVFFFLEPDAPDGKKILSAQFRTIRAKNEDLSPSLARLIELAEKQRLAYISVRDDLGYEPTPFAPPVRAKGDTLDKYALSVRKWLTWDTMSTYDERRLAIESRGALVFQPHGYKGAWQIETDSDVIGLSLYYAEHPILLVRKQRDDSRMSFTLAHELAHIVLHKDSVADFESELHSQLQREVEANEFAAELLLPKHLVLGFDADHPPQNPEQFSDWLQPLTKQHGVSAAMALLRLTRLNVVSGDLYKRYQKFYEIRNAQPAKRGNRKWRHREPKHLFGQGFVSTIFDALAEKKVSLVKASNYLDGLKIHDIKKLQEHISAHA
jgi:Zn-dependent peptidase ImmA (M78 family)